MIDLNPNLVEAVKKQVLENVVECTLWYKEQYKRYKDLLKDELQEKMIEGLNNNFGAKLELYSVYDILQKCILCHFSETVEDRFFTGSKKPQNWLDCSYNVFTLTEILGIYFQETGMGLKINLHVGLEDRDVRNSLTHSGKIKKCLSIIRLYNVVREMLIFMEENNSSILPVFEYPSDFAFNVQDFMDFTDDFEHDDATTILIVNSLHDIPTSNLEVMANMPWDIVIDFDGMSENGGLLSSVVHKNLMKVNSDLSTIKNLPLSKELTTWIKMTDNQALMKNTYINGLSDSFAENPRDLANKLHKFYTTLLVDNLMQKRVSPLSIVFIGNYEIEMRKLLDVVIGSCDDFKISYIYSCDYEWSDRNMYDILKDIFTDVNSHYRIYNTPLCVFFNSIYSYRDELIAKHSDEKPIMMPSDSGLKEVNQNVWINLQNCFEIIHSECGKTQDWEVAVSEFYKGGIADWSVFYNNQVVDVLDSITYQNTVKDIKNTLQRIPENLNDKIFYIHHTAGIGGTTLLRKIAWDLHLEYSALRIKRYVRGEIKEQIRSFYDFHSRSGILLIVDEGDFSDSEINDIKSEILLSERSCALIIAKRLDGQNLDKYNIIPLRKIKSDSIRLLINQFKKHTTLSESILKDKDDKFESVFAEKTLRCPFIIGLYYLEKDFYGIESYVEKILRGIKGQKTNIEVLLIIAACNYYARQGMPKSVVNNKLNIHEEYLYTHPYAKDAFFKSQSDGTSIYVCRHPLLSKNIMDECSKILYGQKHEEYLDRISNLLIESILSACKVKVPSIFSLLLEKIFITQKVYTFDDGELASHSDFSMLIENIKLAVTREKVLNDLIEKYEAIVSKLDDSEENNMLAFMTLSHFYGHLSRIHSKVGSGTNNEVKAISDCERAVSYMERVNQKDSYIYHMYGMALGNYCRSIIEFDKEIDEIEMYLEKAIDMFNKSAEQGNIDYSILSKLSLSIKYLQYVYARKHIESNENTNRLTDYQKEIKSSIEIMISELESINLTIKAEQTFKTLEAKYRSNIMFGNFSSAIQYYENEINNLRKSGGSQGGLIVSSLGLLNALLGKYKSSSKEEDYYESIPQKDVKRMLDILEELMEYAVDERDYRERQQRIYLYKKWIQLSKHSDKDVSYAISIVRQWTDLEEKSKGNNILPYYYMYILNYLKCIEGYKDNLHEAESFRKKCYQFAIKRQSDSYCDIRKINDVLTEGKGIAQLKDIRYIGKVSHAVSKYKLMKIVGKFNTVEANKGIVSITSPIGLNGVIAKFTLGEGNTLSEYQTGHKIEFYAGFSFEQIIAIDSSVVDLDIGESFTDRKNIDNKTLSRTIKNNVSSKSENVTSIKKGNYVAFSYVKCLKYKNGQKYALIGMVGKNERCILHISKISCDSVTQSNFNKLEAFCKKNKLNVQLEIHNEKGWEASLRNQKVDFDKLDELKSN